VATEPDVEGSSANRGPDEPMRYGKWSVRATLVSVRDLDRSALFYKIVMGLTEITRQDQIAVLGRPSEDSPEVVLRVALRVAGRSGQALGLRAISFDVGSFEDLDRVECSLREHQGFRDKGSLGTPRSFEYVRGYDPDRQPLIFMAYAPGTEFSADHYRQIIGSMYAVDV